MLGLALMMLSAQSAAEPARTVNDQLLGLAEEFTKYGCPVGKMVLDVDIDNGAISKAAAEVLQCIMGWAEMQFRELGQEGASKVFAATLLSGIQGSVVLAKAMQDKQFMLSELARLSHFVDQLPNKRIMLGKVSLKAEVA